MCNTDTNRKWVEFFLAELGSSLPEEDIVKILEFVKQIVITDPQTVLTYGLKYQKMSADKISKIAKRIERNKTVPDGSKHIAAIQNAIIAYNSTVKKYGVTNNKLLYKSTRNLIKKDAAELKGYMLLYEKNYADLQELKDSLQEIINFLIQYIVCGKLKLVQVEELLNQYDSGDKSKIRNDFERGTVKKSMEAFERQLNSLTQSYTNCLQCKVSVESELESEHRVILSMNNVINTLIPAFEHNSIL